MDFSIPSLMNHYASKMDIFATRIVRGAYWSVPPNVFFKKHIPYYNADGSPNGDRSYYNVNSLTKGMGATLAVAFISSTFAEAIGRISSSLYPAKKQNILQKMLKWTKDNPHDLLASSVIIGLIASRNNNILNKKPKGDDKNV